MIESISVRDFKGQTFQQPLEQFNLFVGNNGAGKSARSQAIQLLLLGYIPGASKVNHQIVSNFSDGSFLVSGKIDGVEYERKFTTTKGGNTTASFRISKRRSDKAEFTQKTEKFPVCFDIRQFVELSDAKKLEYIFQILPNSEKIRDSDEKTEQAKAAFNQAVQKDKDISRTLQRLSESHAKYDVAGDLPSIEREIQAAEAELEAVRADIEKQKAQESAKERPAENHPINPINRIMSVIEKTCGTSCSVFQIARKLAG